MKNIPKIPLSEVFINNLKVKYIKRHGIKLFLTLENETIIKNSEIDKKEKVLVKCSICNTKKLVLYNTKFFCKKYECSSCVTKRYFTNKNNRKLKIKKGETRHFLTIKEILWDHKPIKYLAQCQCGKTRIISSQDFGRIKTCGCKFHVCGENNPNYTGYKQISGTLWKRIKHGAKKRNIDFLISIQDVWEVLEKQNFKCAYTNIELKISHNKTTASLDRIDSSKSYTKNNIQWVHKDINRMKNNFSEEYFLNMVKEIYENKLAVLYEYKMS